MRQASALTHERGMRHRRSEHIGLDFFVKVSVGGNIVSRFLLCDAMHKRGLCCRPVSVTLVHCIQTAEDTVKLLSRPGSPIILVFCLPAPVSNSEGTPSVGAQNTRGWENFAIFN